MQERSVPRRPLVQVTMNGLQREVETGTPLSHLLPARVAGHPVVAGLFNHKPVSLNWPVTSDGELAPLSSDHWEGQRIFRHSHGLLLLEAAQRLSPPARLSLGPSIGGAQWIQLASDEPRTEEALADALNLELDELVLADLPLRQEWWTVEEASAQLAEQGWQDAVQLLHTWREATVPLVSCGGLYALSLVPLLPRTSLMKGIRVMPHAEGLALHFAGNGRPAAARPASPATANQMAQRHRRWLDALEIDCVGAFNAHCISGRVGQVIRIGEGFHEKRIAQVADQIAAEPLRQRIICVAGPSSSGKSTFIKRLKVQLQINELHPVTLSLDDYFLNREQTPVDEAGERDFEAWEALDLALLNEQLTRLLAGEAVHLARYDFLTGQSHPAGGPETRLDEHDVLLVEGIHGLNPRLLADLLPPEQVFRIFVHPMTALPFDGLTRVNVTDVRLLRRIVRDRHHRGLNAADNILRWPQVRAGERKHIFPYLDQADVVFDSSLIYELSVLKVYAERYLLEVPQGHPAFATAYRLRRLIDTFVTIYPDHVPSTSLLREFIGGSGFEL